MYTLTPDEKTTTVMVYSRTKLIHGNLVTKKEARVNIWLRMQEMKGNLHLLNSEVLLFSGPSSKAVSYNEYFFPIERIFGFHLTMPGTEPLDFDPSVENRSMIDVNLIMGIFIIKGKVRISAQTDFGSMIERSHNTWFSVYDASIDNPFLPEMPTIHTAMLLVNPTQVSFGY